MDMEAQVHRANFAKIAYVELERGTFGKARDRMHQLWSDAELRGDLCTPQELMERERISLKEWMCVLNIGLECWAEEFPLHLMKEYGLESLGLGAAYLTVAPDMRSVLTGFILHWPNIDTNVTMEVSNAKGGLYFRLYYNALSGWLGACFNASAAGLFYKGLLSVSGLRIGDGHSLTFHCPKADSSHLYEEHFNCPVSWEERPDGMLGQTWFVPDHVLDRRNPNHEPNFYNQMSERLWDFSVSKTKEAGENTTHSSMVRLRLSSSIKIPSQQEMAKAMQCSVRTLQQHLRDEGCSWQELLDTETINRAKGSLTGGASVDAVADQLGVSPSNFRRRFKTVTGHTPREFLAGNG